ncbi:hypothetical protein O7599_05315 [Streptomyces sp. WMMC500]|nr:glycosyl hydrolase family 65 protein [Streptomyces sp. WMMC500]WBB64393.1 hypothetical protein O7599_05315 [Streptomyces sp. WMMC500]
MPQMSEYALRVRYRDHWAIELRLRAERLQVTVPPSTATRLSTITAANLTPETHR